MNTPFIKELLKNNWREVSPGIEYRKNNWFIVADTSSWWQVGTDAPHVYLMYRNRTLKMQHGRLT